ncbi:hypothetical protein ACEP28_04940 [Pseudomonas aeruginosa]|uniref:hypothetical protein n=1 Tax=Pseudomonadaceae TaxID=135621 RepID=UPI000B5A2E4F|nr:MULTISPECIES: hypothetical protein [Pseudomonas aeruginosa group]ASJ88712.1 hypothetical protein PSA83_06586 [Pseudomonas aeruginosa]MCO3748024.1 hypothetical protein [Pseudomonas aeruginosa]BDC78668.1 hypothetical protein MRCP2_p4030 [Pseudomonas alcaligenes]
MSASSHASATGHSETASQPESASSHLGWKPKCETDEQLLKELAKDDSFGITRIQRLMGWGYNRAGRKADELLARGMTKQVPGVPYKFFVADKADLGPDKPSP